MLDVAFAIPGDITAPTGGYAYARKVLEMLADYGVQPHHVPLPGSFPRPGPSDIARTRHIFAQLDPATTALIDGLAYGAMPPELVDAITQPIIALVHHPLAYETGITAEDARRFDAYERHALARARHAIVSSPTTARLLTAEYGVPPGKISIAEPGTTPALRAKGSRTQAATPQQLPLQLLAVGSVVPRKGYLDLVNALQPLQHLDWHLTIAGAIDRDSKHARELRELILVSGQRGRITLTGALPDRDLHQLYTNADVFVMSSHYEGYGMVISEAIARGLPIVCTTGGAMADTAPDAVAIKVPPSTPESLSGALAEIISDDELRLRLATSSWQAATGLPRWEASVERIARTIRTVHQADRS